MIDYRNIQPADYESIRGFLGENGWKKRVADAERFRLMMDRADRTVVATDAGRIVGFARALCDGVSNGYIGTVAVAEHMRGKGVGREMVRQLMGDDPQITWVLRAGHGSDGFWQKMGFARSEVAMEQNRAPGL